MKLLIETIALDAMPFLPMIYGELSKLEGIEWNWAIVEGVAAPEKCTKWCAPMTPRLSEDGTTGYVEKLCQFDKRVQHYKKELWRGKVEMLNAPLRQLHEDVVLFQMDADEIWKAENIASVHTLLSTSPKINCARFFCRYFIGPDIVITSKDTFGNNSAYEWHRAWRVQAGVRWESHEPPRLANFEEKPLTQQETENLGLTFDHYAYAIESQVAFKQKYYGSSNNRENGHRYANAVEGWRRLQANTQWPVKEVSAYLPFVGPGVTANRIQL